MGDAPREALPPAVTRVPRAPGGSVAATRPANLADVRTLVEFYLGQPPESRHVYHPFPFRRWPLAALFSYMVIERPFSRLLVRLIPHAAMVLLVAHRAGSERPIGYCTVRFPPTPDGIRKALFGSYVSDEARGMGVGKLLMAGAKQVGREHGAAFLTTTFLGTNPTTSVWAKNGEFTVYPAPPDLRAPGEANFIAETPLFPEAGPTAREGSLARPEPRVAR